MRPQGGEGGAYNVGIETRGRIGDYFTFILCLVAIVSILYFPKTLAEVFLMLLSEVLLIDDAED